MIEEYFKRLEQVIHNLAVGSAYSITKRTFNNEQGFITGTVVFLNKFRLEFMEVVDTKIDTKLKYRYHLADQDNALIFRYDNAPHHQELRSFPHHKHTSTGTLDSQEQSLSDVLLEIAAIIKEKSASCEDSADIVRRQAGKPDPPP